MNKKTIIFVVLLLLFLVTGGYAGYRYFTNSRNSNDLEGAKALVTAGDYTQAIEKCDEVLNSDPNSLEALQVKADAAQGMLDFASAQQLYQKLFDLTQNNYYLIQIQNIQYGNTSGNTLNGGQVIEAGNETFYVTFDSVTTDNQPVYTYNLWSDLDGNKQSIFVDEGSNAYIGELQRWSNFLYFRTSQGLKKLNLYTKEFSDFGIDTVTAIDTANYTTADKLVIYNGEFFFIQTAYQNNYFTVNSINKCSLDGHNVTEIVPTQEATDQGITRINSFFPVGSKIYFRTTNNTGYSLRSFNNGQVTNIMGSESMDEIFCLNNSYVYVPAVQDGATEPLVFRVSIGDDSVSPLSSVIPANTTFGLNCDESVLLVNTPTGLTQDDISDAVATEIGNFLLPATENVYIYLIGSGIIMYQTGNYTGTYQSKISTISRDNINTVSDLFNGNQVT